jgi:nitrate/nitrite-specific signal transduction histidine kinase
MPKNEQKQNSQNADVDEYTAKMDRMVNNLKRRSQDDRKTRVRNMLIWFAVGLIIILVSIYIMINTIGSGGFEGAENLFS